MLNQKLIYSNQAKKLVKKLFCGSVSICPFYHQIGVPNKRELSTDKSLKNVLPSIEELKNQTGAKVINYLERTKDMKIVSEEFKGFIDSAEQIIFISKQTVLAASEAELEAYQFNYLALIPYKVILIVEEEEKRLLNLLKTKDENAYVDTREEDYFKIIGPELPVSTTHYIQKLSLKDTLFRVKTIKRFLTAIINHILNLAKFPRYSGLVSVLSYQLYRLFSNPKGGSNYMFGSLTISTICLFRSEKLQLQDLLLMFEVQLIYCFFSEHPSLVSARTLIKERHNEVLVSELILNSAQFGKGFDPNASDHELSSNAITLMHKYVGTSIMAESCFGVNKTLHKALTTLKESEQDADISEQILVELPFESIEKIKLDERDLIINYVRLIAQLKGIETNEHTLTRPALLAGASLVVSAISLKGVSRTRIREGIIQGKFESAILNLGIQLYQLLSEAFGLKKKTLNTVVSNRQSYYDINKHPLDTLIIEEQGKRSSKKEDSRLYPATTKEETSVRLKPKHHIHDNFIVASDANAGLKAIPNSIIVNVQVAADLLAALSRLPSKIFDLDSLLYFYFHSVDDKEKKELLQREVTRLICFSIFIVEVAKKNTESPYLNEITLELFVNKSLDGRGRIYYSYIADVQTSPVFRILATTGSAPVGPYKALYKAAALKLLVDGKQILGSVNEVAKHFKPSSAPVPSKVLRSKLLKDFRYFLFYQVYYYTSLLPDEELTAAGLEFDHTSSGPQLIGIVTKDVLLSVGTNAGCYSKENEKSFEDTWFRDFYADALAFGQKEDPKLHARFKQCGIDITRSGMKSFIMVYTYAKEEFSLQTQEVRDDLLLSNTQAGYKYGLISFKSRVPDSPLFKLLDLENPTITNLNLLNAEETKQYTTDCMTEPVLIFRSLINSLNKHYPSLTNFLRSVRELVVSDKTEFVRFPLCIFDATDKEPVTVQVRYLQKESHRVGANFSMHSRMPSVTVDVPLVKPTSPEEILEKSETILLDATSSSPTKSAPARRIRMSASLSYKQLPEKINIRVTKRSLAANWVHAGDASLLFRVLQELSLAKCYPAHIHDCYIIHPKDLILLLNTIRKQAALCSDLARSNLYAALLDHQQWVHENLRFYSAKMNEYSSEVLAPKSLQNALASAKEAVKLFDKHAVPLLKQMELVDVIDYTPGFYVNL